MEDKTILDFKNVFFSYRDSAILEDVSFSVRQNDFIALIGPNGGGETTVL